MAGDDLDASFGDTVVFGKKVDQFLICTAVNGRRLYFYLYGVAMKAHNFVLPGAGLDVDF